MKSLVVKNVFQRLGKTEESDEERGGLKSGKLKENWREDLEYRKRLIRIIKGNNYEKQIKNLLYGSRAGSRKKIKKT